MSQCASHKLLVVSSVVCCACEWMTSFWKSDKCYVEYGVDGSLCSFRYYLSEVGFNQSILPSLCINS